MKMQGSVEEEWIRVAEDPSFIMSLFGFCNMVLKIRRLMVITRRTLRAMLVTLADIMQNVRFSSHASRTVEGRKAVERLPCLSSAFGRQ